MTGSFGVSYETCHFRSKALTEGGKIAVEDERCGAEKGGRKSQEASLYRAVDKEG